MGEGEGNREEEGWEVNSGKLESRRLRKGVETRELEGGLTFCMDEGEGGLTRKEGCLRSEGEGKEVAPWQGDWMIKKNWQETEDGREGRCRAG